MSEKMFTQDEVNQIVSERLKRVKAAADGEHSTDNNKSGNNDTLAEREQAITRRENRSACADYLDTLSISKEHRKELLESLNVDNVEAFKATANRMVKAFGLEKIRTIKGATVANPPVNRAGSNLEDDLRDAFKLRKKGL